MASSNHSNEHSITSTMQSLHLAPQAGSTSSARPKASMKRSHKRPSDKVQVRRVYGTVQEVENRLQHLQLATSQPSNFSYRDLLAARQVAARNRFSNLHRFPPREAQRLLGGLQPLQQGNVSGFFHRWQVAPRKAGIQRKIAPVGALLEMRGMLEELHRLHANVDSYFESVELHEKQPPFQETITTRTNQGRDCSRVDVCSCNSLSVSEQDVQRALWTYMTQDRFTSASMQETHCATNDVAVRSFQATIRVHGEDVAQQYRLAARRYDETDRLVIVWKVIVKPYTNAPAWATSFSEIGRQVIRRQPLSTSLSTVVKSCFTIEPLGSNFTSDNLTYIMEARKKLMPSSMDDVQHLFRSETPFSI